jgi:hypothetical protein
MVWMTKAVGTKLSAEPFIDAAMEAVRLQEGF